MSHVRCHVSGVLCQVTHYRYHMSGIRCQKISFLFFLFVFLFFSLVKVVELVGGESVINGAYPVYTLPFLAYNFNAITYTGDCAHIQVLTQKNLSTISKISLERQFLR